MTAASAPIRVAIVEDDPEFVRRFTEVIRASERLALVGVAATAREGYALIGHAQAEVYLIDLGLPDENGIHLIRHIARRQPQAMSMVVTVFGDDSHVIRSIQAGAAGYLLKDALPREIVDCICELRDGGAPVSPIIARRLLRLFRTAALAPQPPLAVPTPLTVRETEVLTLIAKGMNFADVGQVLSISAHTVTAHVRKIYQKLSVHSRTEAVFEARQMGLIQ